VIEIFDVLSNPSKSLDLRPLQIEAFVLSPPLLFHLLHSPPRRPLCLLFSLLLLKSPSGFYILLRCFPFFKSLVPRQLLSRAPLPDIWLSEVPQRQPHFHFLVVIVHLVTAVLEGIAEEICELVGLLVFLLEKKLGLLLDTVATKAGD
jgi:hypothetical protein